MSKNPVYKILSLIVDVRPEEALTSGLMFFYFLLITFPAYIIKPVKLSLYLHWLKPERLPYAYLLTALLIGFVVSLNSKLLSVIKRQIFISASLLFFITSLLLFWFLFKLEIRWLSIVFWFWSDVFIATSVTQFWILVNDIYNPHQAKRLVSFFVNGGLLGGIGGSLLASRLTKVVVTEDLLLVCPIALVLCFLIVNLVYRLQKKEEQEEVKEPAKKKKPKIGYGESFRLLKGNRYLMILAGIMAAAIIVTTLIDFQFSYVVGIKFPLKDAKTSFIATFIALMLVFSIFFNIIATNRVLKNFGFRIALLIAPLFLLIGSVAIFLVPVIYFIYWAVLVKGGDKSLAHSLNQSVRELLYIPISPEIKYKAKVFIDMFVNKFAKGLGALLILLFFTTIHFTIKQISFITIIFIIIWIMLNILITREYVGIVKKELKIKWQDADKLVMDKIDVDMTKLVFDTIQIKERSSVLYAMNLFDLIKKEKMSPELKKIISYKSGEVRASSMDSLFELDGEVLLPETEDALGEESLDTQVKEIMSLDVYQNLMEEHISKIASEESKETEVSRMEAAKVMGMMDPNSPVVHNLRKLLRDESPEVVRYAVESAGKLRRREFVPLIIPHLSIPSTRRIASKALVDYGTKITGTLKDYLGDTEEDPHVRRAIPGILAQIGTQRAADLLALELGKGENDVEPVIIEALYKIRSKNSQIKFQEKMILPEIIMKIKKCYLILMELNRVKDEKKETYLVLDLENNLARLLRHIFELLSLIYPQEDINKAYQNICVGTKKAIDYSLELLESILKREIKELILPLVEDIPFEDKVRRCKKLLKTLEKD